MNPNILSNGPAVGNPSAYVNSQIRFRAAFLNALETTPPSDMMQLCDEIASDTLTEEHVFMGDLPAMKEWVGDREMGSIQAHHIRLTNRDWSVGLPIHRNAIEDDKLGLVMRAISALPAKAMRHPAKLIAQVLLNGFAGNANFGNQSDATGANRPVGDGTCYDGGFFFSASHQLESGAVQSNLLNNVALTDSGLESAVQLMRGFTTYDGLDTLDVEPTHLLVGPALEPMAKRLLEQDLRVRNVGDGGTIIAAADSNIHKGTLKLIVSNRLRNYSGGTDYSKAWFLLALNEPVKPLIYQVREPLSVASLVGWDNPETFKTGKLQFGAQGRYAVGLYEWRTAIGSLGA